MKLILRPSIFALLSLTLISAHLSWAQEAEKPAAKTPPPPRIVNRVAAMVNGRPITSSEVRARLVPYVHELQMRYPRQGPEFVAEMLKVKKQIIEELIERELVLGEFDTKGFMMPEQAIDEEINRRILSSHNGKRQLFLDSLRQSGFSYSEFRESVRKEVSVGAMRASRYERNIPPTPDEILTEYSLIKNDFRDLTQDSVQFEKIFMPTYEMAYEVNSIEELYMKAAMLAQDIRKGKVSFSDAAGEFSRDSKAAEGGRWPYVKRVDLAPDFASIVFSAKKGEIIGPIGDPNGFTIVRVIGTKLAPAPALSHGDIKEKVDASVRRKQSEKRYRQWVQRLRDKAIIRVYI